MFTAGGSLASSREFVLMRFPLRTLLLRSGSGRGLSCKAGSVSSMSGTKGRVRWAAELMDAPDRSHHVGHKALERHGLRGSREVQVILGHPLVKLAAFEALGPLQRGRVGSVLLRLRISVGPLQRGRVGSV